MNASTKKISWKINCISIPRAVLQRKTRTVQVISSFPDTQSSSIFIFKTSDHCTQQLSLRERTFRQTRGQKYSAGSFRLSMCVFSCLLKEKWFQFQGWKTGSGCPHILVSFRKELASNLNCCYTACMWMLLAHLGRRTFLGCDLSF